MSTEWRTATVGECLVQVPTGGKPKIQKKDYKNAGSYPVVDQGQSRIAGRTDSLDAVIDNPLPLIVFGDHTRTLKYVDEPFARGADGTQLLRSIDDIDPLFFYYACRSVDLPSRGYNRHFRLLKEKEISFPTDLTVQQSIALLLRQAERAVALQDELIGLLEETKSTSMRQLFTRGLRRETQKETEIGAIPESWKIGPLGDLALFQRGFDITKSAQSKGGTIPVVSSGGVKSFHDVAAVSGPGVVIGRKGSIGSVHYVESDYWPHDTTLWCTDFLGNLPKFVFYRLQLVDMKRLDSGAANPALNRNFLHAEVISWPNVDEQQQIVEILEAIDRKIDLHRRKRDVLDQLFRSMLHKLMAGEISVYDLDLTELLASDGNAA